MLLHRGAGAFRYRRFALQGSEMQKAGLHAASTDGPQVLPIAVLTTRSGRQASNL